MKAVKVDTILIRADMGNMSSDLQNVLLYLSAFFMVFLSFVVFSLCLRVLLWIYIQYADRARRDNREDGSTRGEQWCSRRQESGMWKKWLFQLWNFSNSILGNILNFLFCWRAGQRCCLFSKPSKINTYTYVYQCICFNAKNVEELNS